MKIFTFLRDIIKGGDSKSRLGLLLKCVWHLRNLMHLELSFLEACATLSVHIVRREENLPTRCNSMNLGHMQIMRVCSHINSTVQRESHHLLLGLSESRWDARVGGRAIGRKSRHLSLLEAHSWWSIWSFSGLIKCSLLEWAVGKVVYLCADDYGSL